MNSNNSHLISVIGLANTLGINKSLMFDDFAVFLTKPYTAEFQRIGTSRNLNQREFSELIGITPYYY